MPGKPESDQCAARVPDDAGFFEGRSANARATKAYNTTSPIPRKTAVCIVIASVLYSKQDVRHNLANGPPHERPEHNPRIGQRIAEYTETDRVRKRCQEPFSAGPLLGLPRGRRVDQRLSFLAVLSIQALSP